MRSRRWLHLVVLISVPMLGGCGSQPDTNGETAVVDEAAWRAGVEEWHEGRIGRLRQPDGWLSLVGLEWLEPGDNIVGAGPDAAVHLPEGTAPDRVGVLTLTPASGGQPASIRFAPDPAAEVAIGDAAVTEPVEVVADLPGPATVLSIGTLRATVIDRGGQFAVRLKDTAAPLLSSFEGIERFPLDPSWRIEARFERYDPPKLLPVPTVLGTVEDTPSPGAVVFERDGQTIRIDAQPGGDDGSLFLVFGDTTNGKTTYGGGRFVYSEPPVGDTVVVDFNRSYNPPCVFTPYATCPLPLPEARFKLAIEAGEKVWGEHH
jgi:uncharacterized protein (DUF1684 family)